MDVKRLMLFGGIGGAAGGAVVAAARLLKGGNDRQQPAPRYEPPIEAGGQRPAEPGGPPSSEAPTKTASAVLSEPGDALNTPDHAPPGDAVMPDTSGDDPLVRRQEKAAAADAGAIGGNVDEQAADEPGFPQDPAARPVEEGSGDSEEGFEARDADLGGNRQTEP